LLNALALAPGPQTAAELRDAVRRGGAKVEEFEVLQELRRLQNQSVVRVEGTRWRLLKMPANIKTTPPVRKPSPLPPTGGAESAGGRTNAVISKVLAPPPAPAGRWRQFRAMCRYYMDCLLQDQARSCAPTLKRGRHMDCRSAVRGRGWLRWRLRCLARQRTSPFQRNRVRRGEDECVYLCPAHIRETREFPVSSSRFCPADDNGLARRCFHLEPDGHIAVNGAWLGYSCKSRTSISAQWGFRRGEWRGRRR
jgi:hypothetical protein